jgi:septal ring factor EnvC (AmiA/AmiB activator)
MITFKHYLLLTSLCAPVYLYGSDEQNVDKMMDELKKLNKKIAKCDKRLTDVKTQTRDAETQIAQLEKDVNDGKSHWQDLDNYVTIVVEPVYGPDLKRKDKLEKQHAQLVKAKKDVEARLTALIQNS